MGKVFRKRSLSLFTVAILLFLQPRWTVGVESPPVRVQITADRAKYLMGESIYLTVRLVLDKGIKKRVPVPDIRFIGNCCELAVKKLPDGRPQTLQPIQSRYRKDGPSGGRGYRDSTTGIALPEPVPFVEPDGVTPVEFTNLLQTSYAKAINDLGVGDLELWIEWGSPPILSNTVRLTIVEPVILCKMTSQVDFGWDKEGSRECEFSVVTYPKDADGGIQEVFLRGDALLLREGQAVDRECILFQSLGFGQLTPNPALLLAGDGSLHVLICQVPAWYVHVIVPRTALDIGRQLHIFGDTSRAAPIMTQYITGRAVVLEKKPNGSIAAEVAPPVETMEAGPSVPDVPVQGAPHEEKPATEKP